MASGDGNHTRLVHRLRSNTAIFLTIVGPEGTSALRAFFAALVLTIIFFVRITLESALKRERKEWRNVIFYGACLGAMNIIFYLAIERIPLGIGVALEFTGPLAVAFFSARKKQIKNKTKTA